MNPGEHFVLLMVKYRPLPSMCSCLDKKNIGELRDKEIRMDFSFRRKQVSFHSKLCPIKGNTTTLGIPWHTSSIYLPINKLKR
ncbi:hypothetical protein SLEP1_g27806 [Rubroshorea leprosula]|uniref:Uncharacterized protein n=1 Tax=Rubroshorea leprosula TaxID=152421 RepID=A0AAV5JU99_9ROSI|nr:hypothetical protein SLEP1_g27806 [Rubroshorea leprosula]